MNSFKIFVYKTASYRILLTDFDKSRLKSNNSLYSTFDENIEFGENDQIKLNFYLSKYVYSPQRNDNQIMSKKTINHFYELLHMGSKIELILDNKDKYIFIISSIKPVIGKDNIKFEYSCQDEVSYSWSKKNLGMSYSTMNFGGVKNIYDIATDVLRESYINDWYVKPTEDLEVDRDTLYNKKITLTVEDSNPYNIIVEACNNLNAYLKVNYTHKYITFYQKKNIKFSGYRYYSKVNLKELSPDYNMDEMATIMHVYGGTNENDEIISLFPPTPVSFKDWWLSEDSKEFTKDKFNAFDLFNDIIFPFKNKKNTSDYFIYQGFVNSRTGEYLNYNAEFGYEEAPPGTFSTENLLITDKQLANGLLIKWKGTDTLTVTVSAYYKSMNSRDDVSNKPPFFKVEDYQNPDYRYVAEAKSKSLLTFKEQNSFNLSTNGTLFIGTKTSKEAFYYKKDIENEYFLNFDDKFSYIISAYVYNNPDDISTKENIEVITQLFDNELNFYKILSNVPCGGNFLYDFSFFKNNKLLSYSEYENLLKLLEIEMRNNNLYLKCYESDYYKIYSSIYVILEETKEILKNKIGKQLGLIEDDTNDFELELETKKSLLKSYVNKCYNENQKIKDLNLNMLLLDINNDTTQKIFKDNLFQQYVSEYYNYLSLMLEYKNTEYLSEIDEHYIKEKYYSLSILVGEINNNFTYNKEVSHAYIYNDSVGNWEVKNISIPVECVYSQLLNIINECLESSSELLYDNVEKYRNNNTTLWNNFYDKYSQFIYESKYENSDEFNSVGLYNQAISYYEDYNKPNANYSIGVINSSNLELITNPALEVGSKIRVYEEELNLNEKSLIGYNKMDGSPIFNEPLNNIQFTNNDLVVSSLSYKLRSPDDISIGVEKISSYKSILQKLIKNV